MPVVAVCGDGERLQREQPGRTEQIVEIRRVPRDAPVPVVAPIVANEMQPFGRGEVAERDEEVRLSGGVQGRPSVHSRCTRGRDVIR
jgi:hypothetical protein